MPFKKPSQAVPSEDKSLNENVKIGALTDDGALVVLRFIENKPEIQTVNGVSDAVAVDLLVVTGKYAGTFEEDRLIFNSGVLDSFEGMEKGDLMSARFAWKPTKARKMAVLVDASEADEVEAERAWNNRGKITEKSPA